MLALLLAASLQPIIPAAQTEPPASAPAAHPSDAEIATWFKFRRQKFAELKAAAQDQPAELSPR